MKKIFLLLVLSIFAIIAKASVTLNGINYNINSSLCTAVVIKSNYEGDLEIPETINVDGVNYEVTEIDKYAFQNSYLLTSVRLPKSIKSIGALAFANGKEIKIYIENLSAWCSINFGYTGSSNITGYYYDPIAQYRLFVNNSEIVNLEIPEDINYVRANAFSGCRSLQKVSMTDNVSSIGDYAFYNCDNLKIIEFGNNVHSLGKYSLCKCSSIEELTLPQSLQTLNIGALQSMSNLKKLSIPGNVTTIESGCFLGDSNLSLVTFEESSKDIFIGYGQYSGQPIFIGCPLQEVHIARDLKSKTITSYYGYSVPLFQNQTTLTTVMINEGVKIIGSDLFRGCTSLSEINTPNSIEEIGSGAFEGCTSLPITDNIQYAGNCAVKVIDKDSQNYKLKEDTRFILSSCFSGCINLENLELPNNITYWGDYVFSGCTSLKEINIPEKVENIGKGMFSYCENIESIIIPSNIKMIDTDAFSGCKALKEIVIPQSVMGIQNDAFESCYSLTKVILEDSPNSIGMGTNGYYNKALFYDCPLEEVYIGRNMGSYYWTGSRNDYLPFYGNKTIKKLTIGAEVTSFWDYSFYGCVNIEDIYVMHDTPISLENYTFSSEIYSKCRLNVPKNSVSLYSSANIWRNFTNIVENEITGVQNIHFAPNETLKIYNIDGTINNTNRNGIRIIKTYDGKIKKVINRIR